MTPSSPPRLPQSRSAASAAPAPRTVALSHFLRASRGARALFMLRTEHTTMVPTGTACAEKADHDGQRHVHRGLLPDLSLH